MLPRTLAALLALSFAGPALAQGAGAQTQGAGTTPSSQPIILPDTGGIPIVSGTAGERGRAGPVNPGSAAPPGTVGGVGGAASDGTGPLGGKEVTTGGSAAQGKR